MSRDRYAPEFVVTSIVGSTLFYVAHTRRPQRPIAQRYFHDLGQRLGGSGTYFGGLLGAGIGYFVFAIFLKWQLQPLGEAAVRHADAALAVDTGALVIALSLFYLNWRGWLALLTCSSLVLCVVGLMTASSP